MKAAVVSSFATAPRYEDFDLRVPTGGDAMVVDVLAAGLHPRVLSQANGSHYTSTDELPLVPGIDGVGRDADGNLRYFVLPDVTLGSMAERTVIDSRRSIVLPPGTDPIAVAAAMNPAMSSWVALRRRTTFEAGSSVLVIGATGSAGQLAVQVARSFGASRIIAAGRAAERLASLPALGATDTVVFDGDAHRLGEVAADVDVVIDYLWGPPAAAAMTALVTARADRGKPLTWVQIGSVAGATAAIPSAALRASRTQIIGSGQGSVDTRDILAELPAIAQAITDQTFTIDAQPIPLSDIERTWAVAAHSQRRFVITPTS